MAGSNYIGAIDQGTTSTRFVVLDRKGQILAMAQKELSQHYPRPGWVEHDALEMKDATLEVMASALKEARLNAQDLAAIGVTNQRETTVVWDPATGEPYAQAIVWQDTRTADICEQLAAGDPDRFRNAVGLPLATYFSGPKIKWLLDNTPGLPEAAEQGRALAGTVDTWLLWWLSGGPGQGVHVTDVSNASRTMLMNLASLDWDPDMLAAMDIPREMLPAIHPSSHIYAHTREDGPLGASIPLAGVLGDQQAALMGQACFSPGEAKNTYGTGCFLLMNTGREAVQSTNGLLTTLAYQLGDEPPVYALEGSVAMAGSLVQWLRDKLGLVADAAEIEALARTVDDSGGVYLVPAFSGLFAPHWDPKARGLLIGLTHYINKGHLARAVLEASAYQTREIFEAMHQDSGIELSGLKVDGGMVANDLLMQFQADILGIPVVSPQSPETTVMGAAFAAGLAVGYWSGLDEIQDIWVQGKEWQPGMDASRSDELYAGWQKAVQRSLSWLD